MRGPEDNLTSSTCFDLNYEENKEKNKAFFEANTI